MGRCKQLLNDMLITGYVKIDLDTFVRQVPLADLSQFGTTSMFFFTTAGSQGDAFSLA
jgi:hypothetical protein